MDPSPPLRLRVVLLTASVALSVLGAELLVRAVDGGALPSPRMYASVATAPGIALAPFVDVGSWGAGRSYRVATGPHGLRQPADLQPSWLVVGDSQVLGLGVDGADTFAARLAIYGVRAWNAGVVGYSVEDAVARADALLATRPFDVVVVVANRANDWEEVDRPIATRFEVVDGWLLPKDSSVRLGYATGIARLHLVHFGLRAALMRPLSDDPRPAWLVDPAEEQRATDAIVAAVRGLAVRHPDLRVVLAEVPADVLAYPERRRLSSLAVRFPEADAEAWRARVQVLPADGYELVDLRAVLGPEHFLDGDYHLNEQGHSAVTEALGTRVLEHGVR